MELDILFLNVLKFKDKLTGKDKYRIGYILNNPNARQDSNTFKGLNELCFYTDNPILFEKLSGKDSLLPMVLKVEQKPSTSNPLKLISQITAIKTKNEIINLLWF